MYSRRGSLDVCDGGACVTSVRKMRRRALLWQRYAKKIGAFRDARIRYPRQFFLAEGRVIIYERVRHTQNCPRCRTYWNARIVKMTEGPSDGDSQRYPD